MSEFPPTNAKTAMIMSIVSIFCLGIFLAIPAFIMAGSAKKITDAHPGHPDAGSVATARIISGIVIALSLLFFLFYVIMMAGILGSM